MNTDREQSLASMQRAAGLVQRYHAHFWINYDAEQGAGIRHAPEFYD
jgi:hypothetical protein